MQNDDIARVLDEIADVLALKNKNRFRIRDYKRTAQYVRGQQPQLSDRVRESADPVAALNALPGIGEDLGIKIIEILNTGSCMALLRLRKQVPCGHSLPIIVMRTRCASDEAAIFSIRCAR